MHNRDKFKVTLDLTRDQLSLRARRLIYAQMRKTGLSFDEVVERCVLKNLKPNGEFVPKSAKPNTPPRKQQKTRPRANADGVA